MRGVVLGLLLSNLLFWGWEVLLDQNAGGEVVQRPTNGSSRNAQTIRLVSEVDADVLVRFPALNTGGADVGLNSGVGLSENPLNCFEIGPFDNLVDAQDFIDSQSIQTPMAPELRRTPAPGSAVFRVYLPPQESRELAADKLEELRGAFDAHSLNIDSFLVVRGEMENSIALGVFAEQRNALNVQQQLAELGYAVTIQPEQQYLEEAWVTVQGAVSEPDSTRLRDEIDVPGTDIRIIEKLCETIAHDSQFP
jgi:hypothetical protein